MIKDRDIIDQIKAGKYEVLSQLNRHFPSVRKYVLSNSGAIEDAEDVFSEAQVIFYQKVLSDAYQYNGEGKIGGFLYVTSKNLWMKKLTRPAPMMAPVAETDTLDSGDPLEDLSGALDEILYALGDPCAAILTFFYFHRLDMLTIAQKVGYKNKETVKVKKRQCIQTIEKALPAAQKETLKEYLYELDQRRPGAPGSAL
ncbi:MAG: sigma-70 family RNA polymerase sigma factor [Cyclobacteriaceae bacterium]